MPWIPLRAEKKVVRLDVAFRHSDTWAACLEILTPHVWLGPEGSLPPSVRHGQGRAPLGGRVSEPGVTELRWVLS